MGDGWDDKIQKVQITWDLVKGSVKGKNKGGLTRLNDVEYGKPPGPSSMTSSLPTKTRSVPGTVP